MGPFPSLVRDLIPKESLATDRIEGVDQIMADAVAAKFIPAPLTPEQLKELVQIPKRGRYRLSERNRGR